MSRPIGRQQSIRLASGFTLIEVMVTVAIVAILGSLAYPNYIDYVTRGRIVEAITKLGDARVRQEQFFMDNRTYQSAGACGIPNVAAGTKEYFDITCVAPTATTYTITAQGVSQMSAFAYTVDQANVRTSALPVGWTVTAGCWVTKKNGDC